MTLPIAIAVATIIVICVTDVLAPRVRTAAPLILVIIGIGASLVPGMPVVEIEPDLVLEVILPPLLYAAAVRMPAISFRRDLYPISALAITLVISTSLALGAVFAKLVPGLDYVWGVALAAVLTPTDAVATSIIRGGRAPGRVVTILEGESLLNDATALVILRTAVVATAAGFSFWGALGTFAWSLVIAVIIGGLVGLVNFVVRKHIASATVNTALSFTLPFIASVPAELLGSSGLVAAVVAGLVTGTLAPRVIPPRHRWATSENWASIQLLLEGFVFLTMGLQLKAVVTQLGDESIGWLAGLGLAVLGLVVMLGIRALVVRGLLRRLHRSRVHGEAMTTRIDALERMIDAGEQLNVPGRGGRRRRTPAQPRNTERLAARLRRTRADIGYYSRQALGRREGALLVWGGMRGAITVAAAQTLPADTPHRPLLIFIAFAVATLSLLVQGGSTRWLVGRLFPADQPDEEAAQFEADQREAILDLLAGAAASVTQNDEHLPDDAQPPAGQQKPDKATRLAALAAQRTALLDARDDGLFDAEAIESALASLDAEQIAVEVRGDAER